MERDHEVTYSRQEKKQAEVEHKKEEEKESE